MKKHTMSPWTLILTLLSLEGVTRRCDTIKDTLFPYIRIHMEYFRKKKDLRLRVNTKSEQLCNTYNMPDTAAKTLHMLIH